MKNGKMKMLKGIITVVTLMGMFISPAFAHVVVRPNQVGAAAFQTFTIGVPNEKDMATVAMRLVLPEGLNHVSPNVKPGWTIDVTKEGEGEDAKVTEIKWTGGSIPVGQRDEFLFSAQAPAEEGTLIWKAYQTYEDGTTVAWDADPNAEEEDHDDGEEEEAKPGPYSQTEIINDLGEDKESAVQQTVQQTNTPLYLSVLAVLMSGGALWMQTRKK